MPMNEIPELTGSWRNFSPKLDPETAEVFRSIEEATRQQVARYAGVTEGRIAEVVPTLVDRLVAREEE